MIGDKTRRHVNIAVKEGPTGDASRLSTFHNLPEARVFPSEPNTRIFANILISKRCKVLSVVDKIALKLSERFSSQLTFLAISRSSWRSRFIVLVDYGSTTAAFKTALRRHCLVWLASKLFVVLEACI